MVELPSWSIIIAPEAHYIFIPCYTVTFCLTKAVDMELKIKVVVILANKRGCVAQPTLAKNLCGLDCINFVNNFYHGPDIRDVLKENAA